jgi:hypothetical protein
MHARGAAVGGKLEGVWVNKRGQKLYTVAFVPVRAQARLFFHHGLGEHISRYDNGALVLATIELPLALPPAACTQSCIYACSAQCFSTCRSRASP